VSHHPPITAFHLTNRQQGYNINGTILAKSKFYGNSLSALLLGEAQVTLLERGEEYALTMPYAHCKGLILGTLSMELGGQVSVVGGWRAMGAQVSITCARTSYVCDLEFKLKPFFGGSSNAIEGKIKLSNDTLAIISGQWDGQIYLTDKATGKRELFWEPTPDIIKQRLPRLEVPINEQQPYESQRYPFHHSSRDHISEGSRKLTCRILTC
jgi:hypothetical protein